MSDPKFSVGEAVMLRSVDSPELNCNFAICVSRRFGNWNDVLTGRIYTGWAYVLDRNMCDSGYWQESALRPIPKEKPNGIDAFEFINSLKGVEA